MSSLRPLSISISSHSHFAALRRLFMIPITSVRATILPSVPGNGGEDGHVRPESTLEPPRMRHVRRDSVRCGTLEVGPNAHGARLSIPTRVRQPVVPRSRRRADRRTACVLADPNWQPMPTDRRPTVVRRPEADIVERRFSLYARRPAGVRRSGRKLRLYAFGLGLVRVPSANHAYDGLRIPGSTRQGRGLRPYRLLRPVFAGRPYRHMGPSCTTRDRSGRSRPGRGPSPPAPIPCLLR